MEYSRRTYEYYCSNPHYHDVYYDDLFSDKGSFIKPMNGTLKWYMNLRSSWLLHILVKKKSKD
jgi:hypothetical protein